MLRQNILPGTASDTVGTVPIPLRDLDRVLSPCWISCTWTAYFIRTHPVQMSETHWHISRTIPVRCTVPTIFTVLLYVLVVLQFFCISPFPPIIVVPCVKAHEGVLCPLSVWWRYLFLKRRSSWQQIHIFAFPEHRWWPTSSPPPPTLASCGWNLAE